MSFLFGSSKAPSMPYVAPPQTVTPPPTQTVTKEEETKKVRQGASGKKTLLTGPQGLLEQAPVGKKYLLGE